MGADLLLAWLPAFEKTAKRRAEFLSAVDRMDNHSLAQEAEWGYLNVDEDADDSQLAAQARQRIMEAYDAIDDELGDISYLEFPGLDYGVLITGGMSSGDEPSMSHGDVAWIGACGPEVWELITQWARQDFAARYTFTPTGD